MTSPNLERLARKYGVVLGSGSPRRVKLLRDMGIPFEQIVPRVDETMLYRENPLAYVVRLAKTKAARVSENRAGAIVIGCDTVVVLDEKVLDKPADEDEAFRILSTLAGREHVVCTAVALAREATVVASGIERTRVCFNEVSPDEIQEYVATGEPMDKAGAYGIQGMGAFLVDSIEGPLDNVIGLPRKLLEELSGGLSQGLSDPDERR